VLFLFWDIGGTLAKNKRILFRINGCIAIKSDNLRKIEKLRKPNWWVAIQANTAGHSISGMA
jgi:hypothetical protein